jgi:hypothetical protein
MYGYRPRKGMEKFSPLCVHTSGAPPLAHATLMSLFRLYAGLLATGRLELAATTKIFKKLLQIHFFFCGGTLN